MALWLQIESKYTFVLKCVVESDVFLTKAKPAELHSSQDMFSGCVSEMTNSCVFDLLHDYSGGF